MKDFQIFCQSIDGLMELRELFSELTKDQVDTCFTSCNICIGLNPLTCEQNSLILTSFTLHFCKGFSRDFGTGAAKVQNQTKNWRKFSITKKVRSHISKDLRKCEIPDCSGYPKLLIPCQVHHF